MSQAIKEWEAVFIYLTKAEVCSFFLVHGREETSHSIKPAHLMAQPEMGVKSVLKSDPGLLLHHHRASVNYLCKTTGFQCLNSHGPDRA